MSLPFKRLKIISKEVFTKTTLPLDFIHSKLSKKQGVPPPQATITLSDPLPLAIHFPFF